MSSAAVALDVCIEETADGRKRDAEDERVRIARRHQAGHVQNGGAECSLRFNRGAQVQAPHAAALQSQGVLVDHSRHPLRLIAHVHATRS